MAAEEGTITLGTWVIPLIIGSIIMPFVLRFASQYTKTSQDSLSGNIRIENMQVDLSGVKKEMNEMYEKLEKLISTTDHETKKMISELCRRVDALITKVEVHEYRLDSLDKAINELRDMRQDHERKRYKREDGNKGAI